jgi:hypothetical protein
MKMLPPTADAVATLRIRDIPAIYIHVSADNGYVKHEMEKRLSQHVALLSDNRPESRILTPISLGARQWLTPSKFYADELLDWDAAIEVAPTRSSGMLAVTLAYAGRATPSPTREPWD